MPDQQRDGTGRGLTGKRWNVQNLATYTTVPQASMVAYHTTRCDVNERGMPDTETARRDPEEGDSAVWEPLKRDLQDTEGSPGVHLGAGTPKTGRYSKGAGRHTRESGAHASGNTSRTDPEGTGAVWVGPGPTPRPAARWMVRCLLPYHKDPHTVGQEGEG